MEQLKTFKTFENRGDDAEVDMVMPPKQLELDFDNKISYGKPTIPKDHVLCLPSGEVIKLNNDGIDDLFELINMSLIDYNYTYKGIIVNCYCAPDKMVDRIKEAVKSFKNRKSSGNDENEKIALEYSKAMGEVTNKNSTVGHVKSGIEEMRTTGRDGVNYYYIVLPDLTININYYRRILEKMVNVTREMNKKYPNDVFSFVDRINKSNVKYYNRN